MLQKRLSHAVTIQYQEWNHQEIGAWIMGLDNGRFVKYKKAVLRNLEEEEADGDILEMIDAADLKRWGISKIADFKYLQQQIAVLVSNKSNAINSAAAQADTSFEMNEGQNPAPIAFMSCQ